MADDTRTNEPQGVSKLTAHWGPRPRLLVLCGDPNVNRWHCMRGHGVEPGVCPLTKCKETNRG